MRIPNHMPESIDNFEWQGGFVADRKSEPVPPRRPRPVTEVPTKIVATSEPGLCSCESLPPASAKPGQVAWYVEYFLRNVRAGRFLGGPYRTRQAAVAYAVTLLEHDEYEHEVCRLSILGFENGDGGAA